MFAVLIYTDCSAGESVNGRPGFQFQAVSAGATATDEDRIQGGLLHVVPVGLSADQPDTHPPTCTYAALHGRFYLARGRSTGSTVSGRPGNQVTQTIVTGTAGDILPLRPAQLFSAADWALQRAPTRQVAAWEAPLEIDPSFETTGLHRMVTSDQRARDLLPTFLTMVELATGPSPVKLILRHPDQSVVMRWIALASLFEDGARVLGLTFRVFSADPVGEAVQVVGAHPLLSPHVTPATVSGCNVVDLETGAATAVTVSVSAAVHAAWFLHSDPYRAVEAVEVDRRWALWCPPDTAATAAALACLDLDKGPPAYDTVVAGLTALSALATARQHDELDAYGDALVDAVMSRRPQPQEAMEPLIEALWDLSAAEQDLLARDLALAALEWVLEVPGSGESWASSRPGPLDTSRQRRLRWADPEAAARAADLLSEALAAAAAHRLPSWFSLAEELNTGLTAEQVLEPIDRLARYWAVHPEWTPSAGSWVHRDQVEARLREQLCYRFTSGDTRALAALRRGEWDWLTDRAVVVDPDRLPLSAWLAAGGMDGGPLDDRLDILQRAAPHLPAEAAGLFLRERVLPAEAEEIAVWLRVHPGMTPDLEDLVDERASAYRDAGQSEPWGVLSAALRNSRSSGLGPQATAMLEDEERMRAALAEAGRLVLDERNTGLRAVARFPKGSLRLYAAPVAEALLESVDHDAVLAVANAAGGLLDHAVEAATVRMAQAGEVGALTGAARLMAVEPTGLGRCARRGLAAVWEHPAHDAACRQMMSQLAGDPDDVLDTLELSRHRGRLPKGPRHTRGKGVGR